MKNTVLIVSDYILRYAKEKGKGLSVMQLMDYLYFVQAQVLVVKNRPAFPEVLIAKDWGIFVQDVWNKYSWYGNAFIPVSDKPKNSIPNADLIEEVWILWLEKAIMQYLVSYGSRRLTNTVCRIFWIAKFRIKN